MRKILFLFVSLFIVALSVSAQPGQRGGTPEENAKRNTEQMKTSLNLTPAQIAPVDSINLVYAKALAKLWESSSGDFASMREPMQKLQADQLKAFEKVLTDEQLQAYRKSLEERQRNRGNRSN